MLELLLILLSLMLLVAGSLTDLRSREVPDWLSYAGIGIGALVRIVWSVTAQEYRHLLDGLTGFALFWLVGAAMYYTGQWGGGDAKILMALGTINGVHLQWTDFMLGFLANSLIIGAAYGIVWLGVLSLKNSKQMKILFQHLLAKERMTHWISLLGFIACAGAALFFSDPNLQAILLVLGVWCVLFLFLFIWLRTVEECCMKKRVPVHQLTEGDWVAKKVIVNNKQICGPHYEGLTSAQLQQLQKLSFRGKIKNVLIKQGIPFVPNFLIAFIATLVWDNLVFMFF